MKTSLHRIKTKKGVGLCGLLHEPNRRTKTVLAHVHGMGGNFYENKFLDYLADTLTSHGVAFAPFNNSGAGHIQWLNRKGKDIRRGDAYEKFEDCLDDIDAQISFLHKKGYKRIYLSGHSLGAPKGVYYLARTQDKRVAGLILLAPADMHGFTEKNEKAYHRDLQEARRLLKKGKGNELLSHYLDNFYPLSARSYISLNVKAVSGVLSFSDTNYKYRHLNSIQVPILTVLGRKDIAQVVKAEQVRKIMSQNTKKSPGSETIILGQASHSFQGYEQKLADTVLSWINKH